MTTRHDKATEGRAEAAAVDQAIADVETGLAKGCTCGKTNHDLRGFDIDAYHDENDCRLCAALAALRVLADAVENQRGCPFCLFVPVDRDELASHLNGCTGRMGYGGINALEQMQRAEAAEAERDVLRESMTDMWKHLGAEDGVAADLIADELARNTLVRAVDDVTTDAAETLRRLQLAIDERDRLRAELRECQASFGEVESAATRLARQVADLEAFYETAKKYVEAETADEEALGRMLDGTDDDNLDERYRDEQKATRHEADRLFDELRAAARSRDPQEPQT